MGEGFREHLGPRAGFVGAIVTVVVVYAAAMLALSPWLPGQLAHVDSSAKIWQAESLARGQAHLIYPAESFDPELKYVPWRDIVRIDGKPYCQYYNLFVWLELRARLAFGAWGYNILALAQAAAAITVTMLMAWRLRLVSRADLGKTLLVLALCTPMLCYALWPQEHTLAAMFASGAFLLAGWAVTEGIDKPAGWGMPAGTARPVSAAGAGKLAAAGVCLGLASASRGECLMLALALGLTVLWLYRRTGWKSTLGAGASIAAGGVLVLAIWRAICPFAFEIQKAWYEGARVNVVLPAVERFWRFLAGFDPGERASSIMGSSAMDTVAFAGGACLVLAGVFWLFSGFRPCRMRTAGTVLFIAGLLIHLASWRFEGILAVCPFMALAAVAARGWFKSPASRLILYSSAIYIVLCVLFLASSGGSQFGPRHLLPVLPALAVILYGATRAYLIGTSNRWLGTMLALSLALAFSAEVKGLIQYGRAAEMGAKDTAVALRLPRPWVSAGSFLIYRVSSTVLDVPILEPNRPEDLPDIFRILQKKNVGTFTVLTCSATQQEVLDEMRRENIRIVEQHPLASQETAYVVEQKTEQCPPPE